MKLEHLKYFLEAAKQNSISGAAQKLYMSQQALSRTIKALEAELAVPLFKRTASGSALTAYGELLFDFAEKTLNEYDSMTDMFYLMQHQNQAINDAPNELCILANPIFISTIFPPLIRQMRRSYPSALITLYETNTPLLCTYLAENEPTTDKFPIGIGNYPYMNDYLPPELLPAPEQHLIRKPIILGSFLAYVSKSSPLAKYKSLSMHELLKYPVIMYAPDGIADPTTMIFLEAYGQPNYAFFASNIGIMTQYIAMNLGIGYLITLDHTSTVYDDKFTNIATIKIEESARTLANLFYHEKLPLDHPIVKAFIDTLPFLPQAAQEL